MVIKFPLIPFIVVRFTRKIWLTVFRTILKEAIHRNLINVEQAEELQKILLDVVTDLKGK